MRGGRERYVRALLALLVVSTATAAAQSPDWPQWGGPHRNFKSDVRGLAASWPEGGPRKIWFRELGEGYSSIAAADGILYTMYRKGDRDVVVALAADTGKTIWEYEYDAPFVIAGREAEIVKEYHLERGPGPISTPLIVGDLLFTVGGSGKLHCLERKTGRVIWKYDLIVDLNGYIRQRGYACSPLAYKDTIILPVGAVGGTLMAFNQRTGAIVWRKGDYHHAYASPFLIQVDGQHQVVTFLLEGVFGFNPDSGDVLWGHPYGHKEGTHVSTPMWGDGNLLFYSAGYGFGARGPQADEERRRDDRHRSVGEHEDAAALRECDPAGRHDLRLERRLRPELLHRHRRAHRRDRLAGSVARARELHPRGWTIHSRRRGRHACPGGAVGDGADDQLADPAPHQQRLDGAHAGGEDALRPRSES